MNVVDLTNVDWWMILAALLVVLEVVLRIVPTSGPASALGMLVKILNAVIPDKRKFKNKKEDE